MPGLTNPTGIPTKAKADIKAVLIAIAPQVLADKMPAGIDKEKMNDITAAQANELFEAVTREFWRQQIVAHKANEAAEASRKVVVDTNVADPFG